MKNFLAFIVAGLLTGAAARAVVKYLDMPDVHVSHSSGACVRVVEANGTSKPCPKQLPEKYHHIWVK